MGQIPGIMSLITIIAMTTIGQTDASESSMAFRSTGWSQHRAAHASFQPWRTRRQYNRQHNQWRTRDYSNSHSNSGSYIRHSLQPHAHNPFYHHQPPPPVQLLPVHPPTVHVQPIDHNPFYATNPQPEIPIVVQPEPYIPVAEPALPAPIHHFPIIPVPEYAETVDPDPEIVVVKPKPRVYTLVYQMPVPIKNEPTPIIYNDVDPLVIIGKPTPVGNAGPIIYDDIDPVVIPLPARDTSDQPSRGDSPYSRRGTKLDEINTGVVMGTDFSVNSQGLNDAHNELPPTTLQLQDTKNNEPIQADPKLDEQILADVFGTVMNPDVNTDSTSTSPDINSFINAIFSNGNPFDTTGNNANSNTGNQVFAPIDFGSVNTVDSKNTGQHVASLFSPSFQPKPLKLNNPLDKQHSNNVPSFTVSG